ncbi:hypothetical protein L228DRAFT_19425 [Xylona heveae TC161]|uniref:Uncharacterized protein n=1 Tax=Xylona heveae (strain CBS 132557 / TC161) TaxID=1328760 RepID=A0A165JZZ0_XYLHT|nr:hypothetical protein L228DRAFT_19425 [Xylona heveae TC161]KZF26834.1 hypothetical protein L228DRAFT_19425 [Xylona heveae TC161]
MRHFGCFYSYPLASQLSVHGNAYHIIFSSLPFPLSRSAAGAWNRFLFFQSKSSSSSSPSSSLFLINGLEYLKKNMVRDQNLRIVAPHSAYNTGGRIRVSTPIRYQTGFFLLSVWLGRFGRVEGIELFVTKTPGRSKITGFFMVLFFAYAISSIYTMKRKSISQEDRDTI